MNKRLVAVITIFILLGAFASYKVWQRSDNKITATGTIEITKYDVSAKIGGYLTNLKIQQGDRVEAKSLIANVVKQELELGVLRDEAALAKAEAQLRDLEQGARDPERQEMLANVASTASVYEKAQTDYERFVKLHAQGAVADQQLDTAKSQLDGAYNAYQAAKEKLNLLNQGTRPETIEAQRLEVERNRAILKASQVLTNDTAIFSPASGLVLTKNYENGEYVNPGAAIATIGDMNDCWVKIYVPSTQLGLISIGQSTTVKVDSFPGRTFAGVIKEISQNAEFTPRQSITKEERANQVFAVKVKIDNSEGVLKPGMPADVVLQ